MRSVRGLAVVEMAIILPLVLLLLLGIIEYGFAFMKVHQLTNATRHGARKAVLPDATYESVRSEVYAMLDDAGMGGDAHYTFEIDPGVNVEPGQAVTVTVTVDYEDNQALVGAIPQPIGLPVPEQIHASVSMAKEGP